MIAFFFAFAALALPVSHEGPPPFPPTGTATGFGPPPHPPSSAEKALNLEYETRSKALQTEMLALKKADGGKLTWKHREYLHQKADALLISYRRDLQRVD